MLRASARPTQVGFASCGRNAGYPAPPARTRTCSFPASGSSVVLAFAQAIGLIAIPRSEVGLR
jgi:hypothetical protein